MPAVLPRGSQYGMGLCSHFTVTPLWELQYGSDYVTDQAKAFAKDVMERAEMVATRDLTHCKGCGYPSPSARVPVQVHACSARLTAPRVPSLFKR